MTVLKIIALDDEEMALGSLTDAISEAAPDAELHAFRRAEDALDFVERNPCGTAFLDMEMTGFNGLELAEQLRRLNPQLNIIFVTGYDSYLAQAFDLHASGYLKKPVTARKVRAELADLRYPAADCRVLIRTFGNFEAFLDGRPMRFQYTKAKELLAYLVDRQGALCTNAEIATVLFEDGEPHDVYIRRLIKDLTDTLAAAGCGHVILRSRGQLRIVPEAVSCDYFDWNAGKRRDYRGEYMAQYSWAEYTNAMLARTL